MDNGVDHGSAGTSARQRALARDAFGAVLETEARLCRFVLSTREPGARPSVNAFGEPVVFERGEDAAALARSLAKHAALGERVALLATESELAAARSELRAIARERLSVVVHLFANFAGASPEPPGAGADVAFATEGLDWGVLLASGVEDSIDLTLIARRATEDSGTPFVIVHELPVLSARWIEPVRLPDAALCEAFVGAPAQRIKKSSDPAHPVHARMTSRAFAERVPFALASAMRGLEGFTGRRHDLLEKTAAEGAAVMLVGAGALGDALLGEAERLRAAGYDVGAVKLAALRPFPGPRLVRALARALVVTVLETSDEPLAQSNPLVREVKSAFADALTWAPDYPGVGRLPRIHSGVILPGEHELEAGDLDAVVRNMVEGEQGKRLIVYRADTGRADTGGADTAWKLERARDAAPYAATRLAMRGHARDLETANACAELAVTVLEAALALKCRTRVRPARGDADGASGATLELVAGRERPRGVASVGPLQLVLLDDVGVLLAGHPLERLERGGVVALPTDAASEEGFLGELPAYVKAMAFDRGVRVVGFRPSASTGARDPEDGRRLRTAATFAGVLLYAFGAATSASGGGRGARAAIDGSLVEREVEVALRALGSDESRAHEGAALARAAFEAHLEVGRGAVEKDPAAIHLGRSDARAGTLES
jgi:pyruvate/2-oxoacid:ferredoxin oxidoreductase alpha subunit